ncbi:hypothetical protein BC941DRAFT_470393 [Chlamydoabsidia padenii]|nr:hypothetical protein BC941DRAFT_470393 [Chlamydoabsidia padenii]
MLKNFDKFKQWTGERLGSARMTLQTENFQQLETDTENKRAGFEKVHEATEQVYGQLSKKKPSPEDAKTKCTPLENLSSCWINHGADYNDESALGVALINFGQTEAQIALLQDEFANNVKTEYINILEQGLQHYKDYYTLKKKLESRRLDYDSKLCRINKSKKEKPEWEQELQASKIKYEECEQLVIEKMVTLHDYEMDHCNALSQLMEFQLAYHQKSVDLINELRVHMPTLGINRSNRSGIPPLTRSSTNSSSHSSSTSKSGNGGLLSSSVAALKSNQYLPGSRKPSYSSLSSCNSTDQGQLSASRNRSPPPTVPRRKSSPSPAPRKTRKAIFEFEGQAQDELSFNVGDLITVVEPVDEGWWMGEINQDGIRRRGIFPVDYTEDVTTTMTRSPPIPNRPHMMTNNDTHINQCEEGISQHQHQLTGSPFDDNLPSPAAASNVFASIKSNPISQSRSPPISSPSPFLGLPSTPTSSPLSKSSSNISRLATRSPPSPPPSSRISTQPITLTKQVVDCQDCGCDDFSVNLFKKDQCNNCFHRHVV